MKIIKTEIYRFSIPMKPFSIATGTMSYAQNVFIRIYTDTEIYGVGECSAFPVITGETQDTCLVLAQDFARLWKGKDPLDIPKRMKELNEYVAHNNTIKSAFDMALYDLAAKAEEKPLYKFLGGAKRRIETDITVGLGAVKDMVDQAHEFKRNGAGILKIKLGKGVAEDLKRIEKIREKVGSDLIIRVDANQGWDFNEAIEFLTKAERYNIEFCEQPIPKALDDLLSELRLKSPIKIMADESCLDRHDARKLIKKNACDYINIKFSKAGGITEALEIYKTAARSGVGCMLGGMLESRIALSAKVHFAYACPIIDFFDLDTCLLGHLEDPAVNGVEFNNYDLEIADLPGIGADADNNFLKGCESWVI